MGKSIYLPRDAIDRGSPENTAAKAKKELDACWTMNLKVVLYQLLHILHIEREFPLKTLKLLSPLVKEHMEKSFLHENEQPEIFSL
ncbi:hypothetical protein Syun_002767 [Stephania yunnanensis]|uniref:Uncharacterized protein n=1 Tax=Stephania yunnanensis TaxID=152371 RepID=A0AAP0LIB8_9MAGN